MAVKKTVLMEYKTMPPKVLVVSDGHIRQFDIGEHLQVGRSTETQKAELDLGRNFVSRKHGEFGKDRYGVYYKDVGSTNGTYFNGKKLPAEFKRYLYNGDVLQIFNGAREEGKGFVTMVYVTDYPESFSDSQIDLDPSIAEINIGRSGNRDILMGKDTVSANHASFFAERGRWAVVDHKSTNGVFVNNMRIARETYLQPGDCVRITNILFFFLGSALLYQCAPEAQTTVSGENVGAAGEDSLVIHIVERSVWQRTKKLMLLQNINMTINNGEMVLILGGSGAGKTTFMNAVMGYEKANGKIVHGGTDVYEDYDSMKYKIGFVPQQDLLRGSDSVYDTLYNAAEMKLPSSLKKKDRTERIENVLNTLGLQRERNSLVSKLSGGQRKRLSVAVEYIADPALFFLDEPDSGLDGIMAKTLMQNLRTIADEGKIVMVISHGPDRASALFDKVIVLAKSAKDNCGHLAFFGPVDKALSFFETDSLEGVVKRINRPDEGGDGLSDFYIEKYDREMG